MVIVENFVALNIKLQIIILPVDKHFADTY